VVPVEKKLDMFAHKLILSITLLVTLFISLCYGRLVFLEQGGDSLLILVFGLLFIVFVLAILSISMLFRTRDELHVMHEENRQQFQSIQERLREPAKKEPKKR